MTDHLLEAVHEARPALPDDALSPVGPEAQAVLERVLAARRRGRSKSALRRGAPLALAIGATLVVVAVAVLSLRGHAPASRSGGSHGGAPAAVRGEILDRDGRVLAGTTKLTIHLSLVPSKLPRSQSGRIAALKRLAAALEVNLRAPESNPGAGFAELLGSAISPAAARYLSRHRAQFPEVKLVRSRERVYRGPISAQLLTPSGLKASYNADLRAGDTLKTTLDARLESAGEQALQHAIDANPPASGGAFVAMDPDDGEVYAMGSLPTMAPVDRVSQVAGPVGSAFAPITALAALQSGAWSARKTYDDTGQFCFDGQCRHNSGDAVDGMLDVAGALKVGSNDFFYDLGALTNSPAPAGGAVQQWARAFGIGSPTGVDLPPETLGTLPTPAWRAERNRLEADCDAGTGQFAGQPKHAPGGCGIADGSDRPWSAGDNENLAVGQGDVQVTPLQLAVAYAAIENGGTVVRPHVGLAIERQDGTRGQIRAIHPAPARRLKLDGPSLVAVRAGLRDASSEPGGTSADVFSRLPVPVSGETGTAQYNGQQDYAWYAGFIPAGNAAHPIVVVVTVAQGGFGDVAAAPVARQLFSQWVTGHPGPWVAGASHTL